MKDAARFRTPIRCNITLVCRLLACAAVIGGGIVVMAEDALKPQSRTWSDREGKFSVDATFVQLHEQTVTLARSDGKQIDVPLGKLSEADVKYVHSLEESQSPFSSAASSKPASAASNPASASIPAADTKSAGGTTEAAPEGTFESAKGLRPNLKSAKVVRPLTFAKWTFKPKSALQLSDIKPPTTSITLGDIPDSEKFFERVEHIFLGDDLKQAILVRQQGKVGEGRRYLQRIDLTQGHCDELVPLPAKTVVLAVWPAESTVVLGLNGTSTTGSDRLLFAKLDHNQLSSVSAWSPYENESWEPNRRIVFAKFLGPDRLMTENELGSGLAIWNSGTAAATLAIPMKHSSASRWQMSPDRKLLAAFADKAVYIIDLDSGTHVATIDADKLDYDVQFAFSDDNQRLAAISKDSLTVWDLNTGAQQRQFNHMKFLYARAVRWVGDFVLVDHHLLFDPKHEVLLWEYDDPGDITFTSSPGGLVWSASSFHGQAPAQLVAAKLPEEKAVAIAEKLPSPDELRIMKPGDAVQIKIEIDSDIGSVDDVKSAIVANLTEAGFKIADTADLVLTATCQKQKPKTVKFAPARRPGHPGFFRPVDPAEVIERSVTPCASSVAITYKGREIWRRNKLATPGSYVQLEVDQTLDQYLEKATQPDVELLKTTKYTGHFAQPGDATPSGAYGASPLPLATGGGF